MSEPTPPRRPLATFLRPDAGVRTVVDASADARADAGMTDHRSTDDIATDQGNADDIQPNASHEDVTEPADAASAPASARIAAPVPAAIGDVVAHAEPVFLRGGGQRLRTPRWQWTILAALSLLLLLQIAVADRDRLAADAGTRPLVAALCGVLRCPLPAWREPAAFTMVSRDVRPVAQQSGALQVQASIRNDARWAQEWPMLRLTLSDADGRVIGSGGV